MGQQKQCAAPAVAGGLLLHVRRCRGSARAALWAENVWPLHKPIYLQCSCSHYPCAQPANSPPFAPQSCPNPISPLSPSPGRRNFADFLSQYIPPQPGTFVSVEEGRRPLGPCPNVLTVTHGQRPGIGGAADRTYVAGKDVVSPSFFPLPVSLSLCPSVADAPSAGPVRAAALAAVAVGQHRWFCSWADTGAEGDLAGSACYIPLHCIRRI